MELKKYLDHTGFGRLWEKIDQYFVRKSQINALLATIAALEARVAALEAPTPASAGIGYWKIGSTFVIGGQTATDGIGEMAIGTTLVVG